MLGQIIRLTEAYRDDIVRGCWRENAHLQTLSMFRDNQDPADISHCCRLTDVKSPTQHSRRGEPESQLGRFGYAINRSKNWFRFLCQRLSLVLRPGSALTSFQVLGETAGFRIGRGRRLSSSFRATLGTTR